MVGHGRSTTFDVAQQGRGVEIGGQVTERRRQREPKLRRARRIVHGRRPVDNRFRMAAVFGL